MTTDITFRGVDCEIVVNRYAANLQIQLSLRTEIGEPYMTITSCIPDMKFFHNQTLIKDYSENKGIYEALLGSRFVSFSGINVADTKGMVSFPLVFVSNELVSRLNEDSNGNSRD